MLAMQRIVALTMRPSHGVGWRKVESISVKDHEMTMLCISVMHNAVMHNALQNSIVKCSAALYCFVLCCSSHASVEGATLDAMAPNGIKLSHKPCAQ